MAVVVVRNTLPADFGDRWDAIPRAYPVDEWRRWRDICGWHEDDSRFPHCDANVLHAPGECAVCDMSPAKQAARILELVAFSGHPPAPGWQPCPADVARPPGASNWHGRWHGNVAAGNGETIEWAVTRAEVAPPERPGS